MSQSRQNLFAQLSQFGRPFWMLNIMEMIERLAYYGVRTVIPIYIAQADEINGLHFTQIQKGEIFFVWALVQSLVPMFFGRIRGPLRIQEDDCMEYWAQGDRLPSDGYSARLPALHVRLFGARAGHGGL
ncbi:MAG: hypothetical protein IPG71_13020 [bacterium]|nr:hypothetical protein [bacterium]